MKGILKSKAFFAGTLIAVTAVIGMSTITSATVPGINQLVSKTSSGGLANGHASTFIVSEDRRVVALKTLATNMIPSGGAGVYVRDVYSGTVARVDVSTAGVVADAPAYSSPVSISRTGRYVLFYAMSTNLIDGTTITGSNYRLYLRDTVASTTTLISQSTSGVVANGDSASGLGVSSDGRFVAFASTATNIHPDVTTSNHGHLYMLDRSTNTLSVLDRKTDGTIDNTNNWSPQGQMSCDGSLIAFQYGTNLIVGDTYSGHVDVYLLDLRSGSGKLTNITKSANAAALQPTISCAGDYIGFQSRASNLDASVATTIGWNRPFVYDRIGGGFHLVSTTSAGASTNEDICGSISGSYQCVRVSDNGTAVFQANTTSLTGDSGSQTYIKNIFSGITELVPKTSGGITSSSSGSLPYISADGTVVSYLSAATNLVSGDTNGYVDLFMSKTGY